jgi:catechol 2,3-dioxygenase-like lactoylglutathione lyase family enzyme
VSLQIRSIDHVVLRVGDMQAMRRFYCEILGPVHVAYRPEFRNVVELKGPSDGKGPPPPKG